MTGIPDWQPRYPAEAVRHPVDEAAQRLLENRVASQKHAEAIIRKAVEELEREYYLENLADNTRISSNTMPELYSIGVDTATRLGIPPPTFFLDTNPAPNAATLGSNNPSVVLTSGLLDLCEADDELRFVIGHEIGHLICGHTKYRLMAEKYVMIAKLVSLLPIVGATFATLLQVGLNFWYRRSELSADRYGLLVCDHEGSAISALARLAGASRVTIGDALRVQMIEQADEFREAYLARGQAAALWDVLDGLIGKGMSLTHPWPAVRIWELENWRTTTHFKALKAGDIPLAHTERRQVSSFFNVEATSNADPMEALLQEFTGEFGKGVGDLVAKGRSFFGDVLAKGKAEAEKSKNPR
jgi:Zn-dependent protease with chaperone function